MDGWLEDGWIDGQKDGWLDGGMVGWMQCWKTLKLGRLFYMPKNIMKMEGEKYIQEKDENNLGIFFSIKKKYPSWRKKKMKTGDLFFG